MTSTTGTDEHPEVAEISALAEGILPPDRSADLRGHLVDCALCADVRASLEEIRGLLGTLPGPPRIPADVAGRIDAALAAEALLASKGREEAHEEAVSRETTDRVSRETVPAPTATPENRPTTQSSSEQPSSTKPSTDQSSSEQPSTDEPSVAKLPAGRTPTGHTPAGHAPAGRAPAAVGPGRAGLGRIRRRWSKGLLITASVAAVLGLGGIVIAMVQSGDGTDNSSSQATAGKSATDQLQVRVQTLLAGSSTTSTPSPEMQPKTLGAEDGPRAGVSSTVPSCILAGIRRSDRPLAAESFTYRGSASYLVVLAHPSDGSRVDAYVVDSSCVEKTGPPPGKVLRKETYTR